eukprot:EC096071.1.p2 GENE.EC096071.1~~EC096071.1.p2  ORF type:complete len:154 (-),score=14.88 EC096071.1:70-531(-)
MSQIDYTLKPVLNGQILLKQAHPKRNQQNTNNQKSHGVNHFVKNPGRSPRTRNYASALEDYETKKYVSKILLIAHNKKKRQDKLPKYTQIYIYKICASSTIVLDYSVKKRISALLLIYLNILQNQQIRQCAQYKTKNKYIFSKSPFQKNAQIH